MFNFCFLTINQPFAKENVLGFAKLIWTFTFFPVARWQSFCLKFENGFCELWWKEWNIAAFSPEVNAHFYVAIIGESQLASSSVVYMYSFWLWEEAVWWRLRITMGRGSLQKRDRGVKNILSNIYTCSKVWFLRSESKNLISKIRVQVTYTLQK